MPVSDLDGISLNLDFIKTKWKAKGANPWHRRAPRRGREDSEKPDASAFTLLFVIRER